MPLCFLDRMFCHDTDLPQQKRIGFLFFAFIISMALRNVKIGARIPAFY